MCATGGGFYDGPMVRLAAEFLRGRLRRGDQLIPAGYSWSFVAMVNIALVLILAVAVLQRSPADLPAALTAAAVGSGPVAWFFLPGARFKPVWSPILMWASTYTATAVLVFGTSTPIAGDLAPTLLALTLGCVGSLTPLRYSILAVASAVALLAVASATHRLDVLSLYLSMLGLSWLVGLLTRTQAQLLVTQQQMQADLAEHAAADERRRIAREVHDVIAHSLSITLLHVTGARHALQQDRDIDDAVDALSDAERLGRQAMADIRRTVGLLESGPSGTAPEPGIADIGDLVADYVAAGMDVALRAEGGDDEVSAAVGLALYRITQESLANIAKHAPGSKAEVELVISPSAARLSILNALAVPVSAGSGGGRGLAGMRQRAELLGGVLDAGPCRLGWSVCADIPLAEPGPPWLRCPR